MAWYQGCSERSNEAAFAVKYAACAGCRAERSWAISFATAGIVEGLYHRCGLGVLSGRPRRSCTSITLRLAFGVAASILFMYVSYPRPFWTTSPALLTTWATLALASKLCGSVLGLLALAVT